MPDAPDPQPDSERDVAREPGAEHRGREAPWVPPSDLVAQVRDVDPFAIVDLNAQDAASARVFVGVGHGIALLQAAHPGHAGALAAEGVALQGDPVWRDRPPSGAIPAQRAWADALATLTAVDARHLAARAARTENRFVAARYAHVAWRTDRRLADAGRQAVREYVALSAAALDGGDGAAVTDALDRAAEVTAVMGDRDLGGTVRTAVERAAAALEAAYGHRWLMDLVGPVRRLAGRLQPDFAAAYIPHLERAAAFLTAPPPAEYEARRRFLPVHHGPAPQLADRTLARLAELHAEVGQGDAVPGVARRRGEVWEAYADALSVQGVAAVQVRHELTKAEHWYREAGDAAAADRVRVAVERLRDRIADEVDRGTISIPLAPQFLAAVTGDITGAEDVEQALERLVATDAFLPQAAELAPTRAPQTVGDTLMPPVNFDVAGNRATPEGGHEDAREANAYEVAIQVRQTFVSHIFGELRATRGLNATAVMRRLADWPLLDRSRLLLLDSAVSAYFREDYVAFVRTVMPEFEALARGVVRAHGRPTTTRNRRSPGVDEERGLEDLLEREPLLAQSLGEDLAYNLRMLMVKKAGPQLRHADAHALLPADFYTERWADILLLLLLRLTRSRPVEPEAA